MKEFLNQYSRFNRDLQRQSEETLGELFRSTIGTIERPLAERRSAPPML
jgi:hypothetical protein